MANSTVAADGTPLYSGRPVKDMRENVLLKVARFPNRTLKLGDFDMPREQAEWALDMLTRTGKLKRVATNGYRYVEPKSEPKSAAASLERLANNQPAVVDVAKPAPAAVEDDPDAARRSTASRAIFSARKLEAHIIQTLAELSPEWVTTEQLADLIGAKAKSTGTCLWAMRRDGLVIAKNLGTADGGTVFPNKVLFGYSLPSNPHASEALPGDYRRRPTGGPQSAVERAKAAKKVVAAPSAPPVPLPKPEPARAPAPASLPAEGSAPPGLGGILRIRYEAVHHEREALQKELIAVTARLKNLDDEEMKLRAILPLYEQGN